MTRRMASITRSGCSSEIDIDALIEAASEAQEADKEVHEKGYQGEKLA